MYLEKVEVIVETGLKFIAKNKSYCMGQYYTEDDWKIEIIASNMEELIDKAAKEIFKSDINIDDWSIEVVKLIYYKDEILNTWDDFYCYGKDKYPELCSKPFFDLSVIYTSDVYQKLKQEKEEKERKEKEEKERRLREDLEKEELRTYEKLKKKLVKLGKVTEEMVINYKK